MPITKGFRQLVDEAMAQVTTYSVDQVRARLADPKVQIVDIRDPRELEQGGTLPGALLLVLLELVMGVPPLSASLVAMLVIFLMRVAALTFKLRMPTYRERS